MQHSLFRAYHHPSVVQIYDHSIFNMACRQFGLIADRLQITESDRGRPKFPQRSMTVALPLHRDDGSMEIFNSYHVQQHLALHPAKGGLRNHPDMTLAKEDREDVSASRADLTAWPEWYDASAS